MMNNHTPETKKNRKSTVSDLEECLASSFLSQDAQKTFVIPSVREAIGRISFAVQYEKSGLATSDEAEVKKNQEALYWLKLFDLHVNNHLREIVRLVDSNKKQTVAHYDKVEEENTDLRNEIRKLKEQIKDHELTLNTFKEGIKSEDTEQAQKELEKMKEILKESSNIPNVDEELAAAVLHGEKLLGRLDHAKKLISELKYSEVNLATTLGHPVPAVVNSPTQPINIGSNNQSSPPSSPRRSSTFTEKDRKIFELEKKLKELQGVNAKLKQELEEQTERANKAEEDFKILAEWAAQFQNSQEQSNQDEH